MQVVLSPKSRDARGENHRVHEYLTQGIRSVVYTDEYGAEQNPTIRLIDYARPVRRTTSWPRNQVTVVDGDHRRRFDIVLYVNGMPLGVHRAEEGRRRAAPAWRARTPSS